jgi:hypothetical protein
MIRIPSGHARVLSVRWGFSGKPAGLRCRGAVATAFRGGQPGDLDQLE